MINLSQIEHDLTEAMKARNQLVVDVLRGLKTRIQNEKISKMKDLAEADLVALIRSEIKKRKESAEAFTKGGRVEKAEQETREGEVLQKYLPPQMGEAELLILVGQVLAENNFTAADFGKAMAVLKAKAGDMAEGATLSKLLKAKLK